MKKFVLCCLAAIFFGVNLQAQEIIGIQFFEGNFGQALKQASKEKKIIFLDAYASWCGPCKAMSRHVFTKKEVGDFYNANFINLKIDWESREGDKLQAKYPVRAFPALMFIGADGKLLYRAEGYHDAQDLVELGKSMQEKVKK